MEMAPFLKYLPGICFYLVLNYLPPLWDTKKSDAEKSCVPPGAVVNRICCCWRNAGAKAQYGILQQQTAATYTHKNWQ